MTASGATGEMERGAGGGEAAAAAAQVRTDSLIFAAATPEASAAVHDHSAGLLADAAPLQNERREWAPRLPQVLKSPVAAEEVAANPAADSAAAGGSAAGGSSSDAVLKQLFPQTFGQKYVKFVPSADSSAWVSHPPLRVGVVLSGGQAPGGHNVISGIFDYIKQCNPNSQLFGFLNGPHGIFTGNYRNLDAAIINKYRNQGGFDMICSGRHKIETQAQMESSLKICATLDLHGLVVVGGDDSNTNAAVLAEYFKASNANTRVVGCPKTIDGDLRNEYVETSFGFDTAVKTYSELIGNLCTDVATSQNRYHFVRLMGRSASNIAFECALQTRPNLCFIGEEVRAQNRSLKSLVEELVDLILHRSSVGKNYGIILLPEGLIEFIPEVGNCINEINDIVAHGPFEKEKLSAAAGEVFESLPISIREELLLERDPHGNVQVAKIATEKLLILMVQQRLRDMAAAGRADVEAARAAFKPTAHYFGYEGRCSMPSNFDANYCYTLGQTAGALIDLGFTGVMAVASNLKGPVSSWRPAGCPLQRMMNIERRKGKDVPVIKKYLVDTEGPTYKLFCEVREAWKTNDFYRNPGPIQFEGACANLTNYTIEPPTKDDLLPRVPFQAEELRKRYNFLKSEAYLSKLQVERLHAKVDTVPILLKPNARAVAGPRCPVFDQQGQKFVNRAFEAQCKKFHNRIYNIVEESESGGPGAGPGAAGGAGAGAAAAAAAGAGSGSATPSRTGPLRIGVVLQGQQAPGSSNVLHGLFRRLALSGEGGQLIGFKGVTGLLENQHIVIGADDLKLHFNQGGFELLGRTEATKASVRTDAGLEKVRMTCEALSLDGLVMIGGQTSLTDAALVAEYLLTRDCKTAVIGVPATQENNLRHSLIEACIGFDSTSKCYSSLIGNFLTDAASATKYWYFIRLMGQVPSHMVLEAALQTHPNIAVISEKYVHEDRDLGEVVSDIADAVATRASYGKNFGTVLIPEGLVSQLPNLRQLYATLGTLVQETPDSEYQRMREDLVNNVAESPYMAKMAPWMRALFASLPPFFRSQLVQRHSIELTELNTEQLLAHLVDVELKRRRAQGMYSGSFSPVCHYLGFQGRSTLPSVFDCRLGLAHGYVAAIAIRAGLSGYVTSIRGLCGPPATWKTSLVPLAALMKVVPEREASQYGRDIPMVPCAEVQMDAKPFAAFDTAAEVWEKDDKFCNPGPIQFQGPAADFYNRTLFEEHHGYLEMLGQLERLTSYVENVCTFGVDEAILRTSVFVLEGLCKILAHPGNKSAESR